MLAVPAKCCTAGAQGWTWVDEGKNGQAKWGWVSDKPGSKLRFTVSLPTPSFANLHHLATVCPTLRRRQKQGAVAYRVHLPVGAW